ncbi:hypothetical protein KC318_g34 [Hortaea werneckii]|nr:hypothetical protein KC334_g31 [Hortaea werneckii]KAI7028357.1 hypothetical protein KC355_g34 [Hortaea werneckii]KAI7676811.1 hypothetical protein KC318_g34 [Hortaea werneckii]
MVGRGSSGPHNLGGVPEGTGIRLGIRGGVRCLGMMRRRGKMGGTGGSMMGLGFEGDVIMGFGRGDGGGRGSGGGSISGDYIERWWVLRRKEGKGSGVARSVRMVDPGIQTEKKKKNKGTGSIC